MDLSYNFRNKDPIIDLLRTLLQTYAAIEGIKFGVAMRRMEAESRGGLKASTLRNWFYGETRFPQYRHVARLTLLLRRYSQRPVAIGDRQARPVPVRGRAAA